LACFIASRFSLSRAAFRAHSSSSCSSVQPRRSTMFFSVRIDHHVCWICQHMQRIVFQETRLMHRSRRRTRKAWRYVLVRLDNRNAGHAWTVNILHHIGGMHGYHKEMCSRVFHLEGVYPRDLATLAAKFHVDTSSDVGERGAGTGVSAVEAGGARGPGGLWFHRVSRAMDIENGLVAFVVFLVLGINAHRQTTYIVCNSR
jgi:hypothetical protein